MVIISKTYRSLIRSSNLRKLTYCTSALQALRGYPWWCRSDLDDQIERHVNNPHIANAKKGRKITPICGTNRRNPVAIWPQDTCHLHRNKHSKGKLVKSWKAFSDLKIQIGSYFKSEECYTETWTKMLQSKTRSKDLKTQSCNELYIKGSRSNLQSH